MDEPTIRIAGEADLPAIMDLYHHYVRTSVATFDLEPLDAARQKKWFTRFSDDNPLFVCEAPEIVGFAYYVPYRTKPGYGRTRETTVYVAPNVTTRGIGTLLYQALFDHGRAAGIHSFVAVIAGDNPASQALHRRFGFTPVGTFHEAGHKFGGYVDTHLLECLL